MPIALVEMLAQRGARTGARTLPIETLVLCRMRPQGHPARFVEIFVPAVGRAAAAVV